MIATARLSTGEPVSYSCDPSTHRIVVRDADGRPTLAFGGQGSRAGELDTPLALALVAPEFHGERLPMQHDAMWLAVADYGNRRVQIFELDGCPVGNVALGPAVAGFGGPCRLTWRAPMLEVGYPDGRTVSVHLAGALWRHPATALLPHTLAVVPLACASETRH
jgi:hypothetical protein